LGSQAQEVPSECDKSEQRDHETSGSRKAAMRDAPWPNANDIAREALVMPVASEPFEAVYDDVVEQALRIAVSDVVLPVLWRDAHAGALSTNRSGHRVDDLEQEPHTALDAASISVRALVGAVAQELIDQIAVRAMYLDTVEAGGKRVPRSLRMLRDDAADLGCLKRAWRGNLLEAVCREGFCVRPNGGRRNRQDIAGLEGGMGDAPDMPELEHHAAATSMDCTGYAFPACDLLGAVDARRADIALALGRDLGCFRDDKSGAGPLGVIQRAQRGGHVAGARAASIQGRADRVAATSLRARKGRITADEILRAAGTAVELDCAPVGNTALLKSVVGGDASRGSLLRRASAH